MHTKYLANGIYIIEQRKYDKHRWGKSQTLLAAELKKAVTVLNVYNKSLSLSMG